MFNKAILKRYGKESEGMKLKKSAALITAIVIGISIFLPSYASASAPTTNLREIFESMGAWVTWDEATKSTQIIRGQVNLKFRTGSNIAIKNGISVAMDSPISIKNGKAQISVYAVYPLAKDNRRERHYMVKSGDTLWKISMNYGVTVEQLRHWNNLQSDTIYVNQHLATKDPYYIVQSGDNLYLIANRTQTSVEEIKRANNLTSTVLMIGQKLLIPVPASIPQPPMFVDAVFPLIDKTYDVFTNNYGDERSFTLGETSRVHEGIDIMAKTYVPLFATEDGVVNRFGWSTLGGWRLTVKSANGIAYYYAHMFGYAAGVTNGAKLSKGQLIGFVGATGYGTEGTSGKFVPHLHFSFYDTNVNPWKPINPYPYLKWWENR